MADTPVVSIPAWHHLLEKICLYLIIVGGLLLMGYELRKTHEENVQLQTQIVALQDAQKNRDSLLATQISQLNSAQAAVKTPIQAAQAIPSHLPVSLPQPITINVPPTTPGQPPPDAVANIPQADLKPLFDELIGCQKAELQVPVLTQDLADEKQINKDLKAKNSFKHRVVTAAKYIGIGVAVGAILVLASGH